MHSTHDFVHCWIILIHVLTLPYESHALFPLKEWFLNKQVTFKSGL